MKRIVKTIVCFVILSAGFAGMAQAEPVTTGNGSAVTTGKTAKVKHKKHHKKHKKHHKGTKTATTVKPAN